LYALDVEEIRERAYALNFLAAPVGGGGCGRAAAHRR
jgi:hypothetical protein